MILVLLATSHKRSDQPAVSYGSAMDKSIRQEPALGLYWSCKFDILNYKHRPVEYSVVTMRNRYRILSNQYDHLGYIVHFTTHTKVIVHHLWKKRRDWHDTSLHGLTSLKM